MPGKRITSIPSRQLTPHHMATNWYDVGALSENGETGPCVPPTIAEFRARFPEFADTSDLLVQMALDDASCWADASWIGGAAPIGCANCKTAIAFLAAHYLALGRIAAAGLPTTETTDPETGVVIPGGQVTSISFETMSVGFSPPKYGAPTGGGGSATEGMWDIEATPYGQRYAELLKVNQPAVLVV